MRYLALIGSTLTAAVILAGCSGSGSTGTASVPNNNTVGSQSKIQQPGGFKSNSVSRLGLFTSLHHNPGPNMPGAASVYVSDAAFNTITGYLQTGGSPTYSTSSGLSQPQGMAATRFAIYVANTNNSQVLVFKPPSTTPSQTISDPGYFPAGVAVNQRGKSVWVSNICSAPSCGMGNVEQFDGTTGNLLQAITCSNLFRYYFIAAHKNGDVAVDGQDSSGFPHVDLIKSGGNACTSLSSITVQFPGGLNFLPNGDLAILDQLSNTVTTWTAPNYSSSSSTTTLGGGISDPVTFAFTRGNQNLWTANAGSASSTEFAYPAGGSPIVTVTSGLGEPIGVALHPHAQPIQPH